jgi:hypothetical protein
MFSNILLDFRDGIVALVFFAIDHDYTCILLDECSRNLKTDGAKATSSLLTKPLIMAIQLISSLSRRRASHHALARRRLCGNHLAG